MSRKMASLSSDTPRLLYTWLLSHLDVNGCFYADPVMVNNLVFTRLGKTVDEISSLLNELESVGLIIRYQVDGERYLHYPDFEEKQPKIQKDKEGKSDIPMLTPELLQSYSRVTHAEYNIREENIREAKEGIPPIDNSPQPLDPQTPSSEKTENGKEEVKRLSQELISKYGVAMQSDLSLLLGVVSKNLMHGSQQAADAALIHTLKRMLEEKAKGGKHASKYWQDIFVAEIQNYNAQIEETASREFKRRGGNMAGIFKHMGMPP